MSSSFPKQCTRCSRELTRAQWGHLRLIGLQVDEVERLELRDCYCGSTLAICHPTPGTIRPVPETGAQS